MHELAAQIRQQAKALGFDLVGIAPAQQSKYRKYLEDWLASGQAGTMQWLHRRFEERTDPAKYLPNAQSVICVAINYHVRLSPSPSTLGEGRPIQNPQSTIRDETAFPSGRIARYALGDDYHDQIKSRLHKMADWIRTQAPAAQTRCAVDTAPVMEKELAARAGIGWLGKNTCIINPEIGSWLLLGEIITTLDLPPDDPAIDRCGTCRRCIDACPTQAITAPYQLDARRCISYLTIELREEIPAEFRPMLGDWLFGCDICQEVCPWNTQAPASTEPALQPRFQGGRIDLHQLLSFKSADYQQAFRGSAIKRVKLPVLQRNARFLLKEGA